MSNIQIQIPISEIPKPKKIIKNKAVQIWYLKNMAIFALTILAGMAKLVDVPDLGSGAARRVGSSPITRTKASLSRSFFCLGIVNNNVYSLLI